MTEIDDEQPRVQRLNSPPADEPANGEAAEPTDGASVESAEAPPEQLQVS